MIRHVVMWKFKAEACGNTAEENMIEIRDRLLALLPVIPEIKRMEIGFDITRSDMSMDLMLLTEFDSKENLRTYAVHPEHLKVAELLASVTQVRVVHDCEI